MEFYKNYTKKIVRYGRGKGYILQDPSGDMGCNVKDYSTVIYPECENERLEIMNEIERYSLDQQFRYVKFITGIIVHDALSPQIWITLNGDTGTTFWNVKDGVVENISEDNPILLPEFTIAELNGALTSAITVNYKVYKYHIRDGEDLINFENIKVTRTVDDKTELTTKASGYFVAVRRTG